MQEAKKMVCMGYALALLGRSWGNISFVLSLKEKKVVSRKRVKRSLVIKNNDPFNDEHKLIVIFILKIRL